MGNTHFDAFFRFSTSSFRLFSALADGDIIALSPSPVFVGVLVRLGVLQAPLEAAGGRLERTLQQGVDPCHRRRGHGVGTDSAPVPTVTHPRARGVLLMGVSGALLGLLLDGDALVVLTLELAAAVHRLGQVGQRVGVPGAGVRPQGRGDRAHAVGANAPGALAPEGTAGQRLVHVQPLQLLDQVLVHAGEVSRVVLLDQVLEVERDFRVGQLAVDVVIGDLLEGRFDLQVGQVSFLVVVTTVVQMRGFHRGGGRAWRNARPVT